MTVLYDLNSGNGINSAKICSSISREGFGNSFAGIGDLNQDGYKDLAISAPYHSNDNYDYTGIVYVTYGRPDQLLPKQSIESIMANGKGFYIHGPAQSFSLFGKNIVNIGDVNKGGKDDIAILAPTIRNPEVNGTGQIFIIYSEYLNGTDFYTDNINGTNGFVYKVTENANTPGFAISLLGDLDNDGIKDFGIGAPCYNRLGNPYCRGSVTVFYGTNSSLPAVIYDNEFLKYGFRINAVESEKFPIGTCGAYQKQDTWVGFSLSKAGKFDNDTFDDFIFSAPFSQILLPIGYIENVTTGYQNGYTGIAYIYSGKNERFYGTLSTDDLINGNGYTLGHPATDPNDYYCNATHILTLVGTFFGYSVAGGFSINGSSYVLISDYYKGDYGPQGYQMLGASYLISSDAINYQSPVNNINITNFLENSGTYIKSASIVWPLGNFFGSNDTAFGFTDYFYYNGNLMNINQVSQTSFTDLHGNFPLQQGFSLINTNDAISPISSSVNAGDFDNDGFDDALFSSILRYPGNEACVEILFGTNGNPNFPPLPTPSSTPTPSVTPSNTPTPSVTPSISSSPHISPSDDHLSAGAIAGIAVGSVVGAALIGGTAYYFLCHLRNHGGVHYNELQGHHVDTVVHN